MPQAAVRPAAQLRFQQLTTDSCQSAAEPAMPALLCWFMLAVLLTVTGPTALRPELRFVAGRVTTSHYITELLLAELRAGPSHHRAAKGTASHNAQ